MSDTKRNAFGTIGLATTLGVLMLIAGALIAPRAPEQTQCAPCSVSAVVSR